MFDMDSLRGSSGKIGMINLKLAWPLRKDDTHTSRSVNGALTLTTAPCQEHDAADVAWNPLYVDRFLSYEGMILGVPLFASEPRGFRESGLSLRSAQERA